MDSAHRVVIVGGGFGGLYATRSLKRAAAQITLIDRHNYHLFQPLLYQVATGALSPANIAAPLRGLLRRQKNLRVLMAEVIAINLVDRTLELAGEPRQQVPYDTLVLATGSEFNYFGHDAWRELAPGLKNVDDALDIRRRVLGAFERAELENDRDVQRALMTFVVAGGGPTGVELAGALAEVAHHTLRHDFRNINPREAVILLVEAQNTVLPTFPPDLQRRAVEQLKALGVTVRIGTMVTNIDHATVSVKTGNHCETIRAGAVLWTAGVKASPLGATLTAASGQNTDASGRVIVEPDLTLRGHPEVFVIGDLARFDHQGGKPLPGLAPVAIQQGHYVARTITRRLSGQAPLGSFLFVDRGNLATIGRASAVAEFGWLHLSGYVAWLAWLFIHLVFLMQFQNRLLVFLQWCFSYVTRGRSARLITEDSIPDNR
ncbi:MAG TPA: NAD(P)/FAD-dependent oxidoreductase [Pirellulales bacterium]|nr:NAD(P)/FAD-dependent oxidoreductase [Pirellulales bacterium]